MSTQTGNMELKTVEGFGDEWARFDQSALADPERNEIFDLYFDVFPWDQLPPDPVGFDLGCGSGRWAKCVAPRTKKLYCIDASAQALEVARRNLSPLPQCEFINASVDEIPLPDASADFGYSLGVLHHIPDTQKGIDACARKLKPGAPLLLYLYYAFDNRPAWFRALWRVSNLGRVVISRLPHSLRYLVSQVIAITTYWPLARLAKLASAFGLNASHFPLSFYKDKSFYTMRTDALDRFGTRLEQRFTKKQIKAMMENSGLENIRFSDHHPFWCAVGFRKKDAQ